MFAVSCRHTEAGVRRRLALAPPPIPEPTFDPEAEARARYEKAIAEATARMEAEQAALRKQLDEAMAQVRRLTGGDVARRIMIRACRLFKLRLEDIKSHRRPHRLIFARQFVMYWMIRRTGLSLPQIGRLLNRDHTTLIHGRRAYIAKRAGMGRHLPEPRDGYEKLEPAP